MRTEYKKILSDIYDKAYSIGHPLTFMELCGTHSQTVAQYGIKNILPQNIRLISGPGCPVCVTDQQDIDSIVGLARVGFPIATYGDILKVPGNQGSLKDAQKAGADVSYVYDVEEALKLKKKKPNLIFFGIGFETTAPMTAWAIKKGLNVYSSHKRFPSALEVLIRNKNLKIDGFINPGHVSAITGIEVYKKFSVPQVIAGFEAMDVLKAVSLLLDQIIVKRSQVQNEYKRLVKKKGNPRAQKIIEEVFELADANWRGLGKIKGSGLKIRKKYQNQDAEYIHKKLLKDIRKKFASQPTVCRCGEILQGLGEPKNCPLFAKRCSPENPCGPCMVSVEGACNILYRYDRSR